MIFLYISAVIFLLLTASEKKEVDKKIYSRVLISNILAIAIVECSKLFL